MSILAGPIRFDFDIHTTRYGPMRAWRRCASWRSRSDSISLPLRTDAIRSGTHFDSVRFADSMLTDLVIGPLLGSKRTNFPNCVQLWRRVGPQ
eukprot:740102-Pyramimonas_sp.AAC.1